MCLNVYVCENFGTKFFLGGGEECETREESIFPKKSESIILARTV